MSFQEFPEQSQALHKIRAKLNVGHTKTQHVWRGKRNRASTYSDLEMYSSNILRHWEGTRLSRFWWVSVPQSSFRLEAKLIGKWERARKAGPFVAAEFVDDFPVRTRVLSPPISLSSLSALHTTATTTSTTTVHCKNLLCRSRRGVVLRISALPSLTQGIVKERSTGRNNSVR